MDHDITTMADSDGVSVHTGFPNPALDRRSSGPRLALDLNQLLIQSPSSTYLFRIAGHRWSDQGIYDGDIAIIEHGMPAKPQDLVIIWHDDTNFGLQRQTDVSPDSSPWGVVTAIIHQLRS